MLGALFGLTSLSFVLGIVAVPILIGSLVLILWKGPRLIAGAGFITGTGLLWTVLLGRVALTCGGPLDTGANGTCVAGDLTAWILVAAVAFAAGVAGSVWAFRRARGA
jgi:hypothetical protein